jgi:hypothetical protein
MFIPCGLNVYTLDGLNNGLNKGINGLNWV